MSSLVEIEASVLEFTRDALRRQTNEFSGLGLVYQGPELARLRSEPGKEQSEIRITFWGSAKAELVDAIEFSCFGTERLTQLKRNSPPGSLRP
jgi:hypothetical protein